VQAEKDKGIAKVNAEEKAGKLKDTDATAQKSELTKKADEEMNRLKQKAAKAKK
jgi:hypothetical protein